MIFREATLADIPRLAEVRLSVKENRLSNPALITTDDYREYLLNRGKGWLCEIDTTVVGFAIVDLIDNIVWALFLQPGYEGKGIGKKLHDDMLDWYFSQTSKSIWLSTGTGTRAENFYKKAGWREGGYQPNGEIRFEMSAEDWRD